MQIMSDVIAVLGSRHGFILEPNQNRIYLSRSNCHHDVPAQLIAEIEIDGERFAIPLGSDAPALPFLDQDTTPTRVKLTGIHPVTGYKLELQIITPFKPRDPQFSTTPVLDLQLKLSRLQSNFRWQPQKDPQTKPVIRLGIKADAISAAGTVEPGLLAWQTTTPRPDSRDRNQPSTKTHTQNDFWLVHRGQIEDGMVVAGDGEDTIHVSWACWADPMLSYHGELLPFRYHSAYPSAETLLDWCRNNPMAIQENARRVDAIFSKHNQSPSISYMQALTLHTWLVNTWWVNHDEREIFTVWEGSCYYHSTIDVEYTQAPFYLAVWPELLEYELDYWPEFVVSGDSILTDCPQAADTVVFMHDSGQCCAIDHTRYDHPMPVEENTNYVLLAYALWRRTGKDSFLKNNAEVIRKALDFLLLADTTGNGVPDRAIANTIDDASPAVQFGREQIYLAVKTMAALQTGSDILRHTGTDAPFHKYLDTARKIAATIQEKGWAGDHFVTLLDPSSHNVVDPWTGQPFPGEKLPGWDAAHIYTVNGIALLDMVGTGVAVDEDKIGIDLKQATWRCLDKYGCRHSEYDEPESQSELIGEGGKSKPNYRIGWISMNMLRDIAAFYRKIDLRTIPERYWNYQVLVNTQGPFGFFETFNGNNLMVYPRGVAIFGYFDALAGLQHDAVAGRTLVSPIDDQTSVPLLLFADWDKGTVPILRNGHWVDA